MSQQVLSQNEIDALLDAMDSGEINTEEVVEELESPKIKPYDFRRPVRLSKEYLSTITMIFEDFAKIAVNLLSTQLRRPVDIKIAAMEQVSFDEFVHSVPSFTMLGIFSSKPLNGYQILEMSPQLSLQMIEILCGFNDVSIENLSQEKEAFTEIEMAILEDISASFLRAFEQSWKDIQEIDGVIENIETNPQLLQTMQPNEPVLLVTFSVGLDQQRTFINMCVPYIFFEEILDKLSFRNWFQSGEDSDHGERDQIAESLSPVPLTLEVLLGESEMTVSEFLSMEEGDIIQLNEKTSKPLSMMVENTPYYKVKPGKLSDKVAVEVLKFTGGEMADEQ